MAEAQAIEKPEVKPQEKKVVGFATRSANKERIEQEEKELEELKKQNTGQVEEEEKEPEPEPVTAEEKSFKKRYGDLRRHSQKKEQDFQKQIDELKTQLDASTKKEIKLPKTEEEIDAWAKEYPDVAGIVETIADKKARERSSDLDKRLENIETMRVEAVKEKAEAELMKLHPDFSDIREDDKFHDWADAQPKWVQDALYENVDDAKSVARVIDLYKIDAGISTKKGDNKKSAATAVNTRSKASPTADESNNYIRESQVDKMSDKDYAKNQEAIMEAMRTGKFVYDLSGAAR